jgi:hypothetical protein
MKDPRGPVREHVGSFSLLRSFSQPLWGLNLIFAAVKSEALRYKPMQLARDTEEIIAIVGSV